MKTVFWLIIVLIITLPNKAFCQGVFGEDLNGNLICTGEIEFKKLSHFEISQCLKDQLLGIESNTNSQLEFVDSSYVIGSWKYTYYVDDFDTFAGSLKFDYLIVAKKKSVRYYFHNFEHIQGSSKFESLGFIPLKWNEKVKFNFSNDQYSEILVGVRLNVLNWHRIIQNNCLK